MKKILTLLVMLVTALMFSNTRYLYRSTSKPSLLPYQTWFSDIYIDTNASNTIWYAVAVNGHLCVGSTTPILGSLSNIFPDSIFQYTSTFATYGNAKYAVIGAGAGGLNSFTTSLNSIAWQYLFYDIGYNSVEKEVLYRDNIYYYWFSSDPELITIPNVNSNGSPVLKNDQFKNLDFSIYPNPTSSILNIETDNQFTASLYDLTGKKLLNFSTKTFDISQLASGIYYLDIILEDKRYTKKIIKQ